MADENTPHLPTQHYGDPITIEKARELFCTLPKDVESSPHQRQAFLEIHGDVVKRKGEAYVKEHRKALLSSWEYVGTLV